ncbi:MAG: serine/threonine protein kinase [Cyanobacteria bacterium SZAS LIN-3]|nr:serine/threonine protein kinase [Cyanobacteria bacterium SZAS LIN-3]
MTQDNSPPSENDQQPANQENDSRVKSRDPLVGTVLDGRFEIEEVLGSGGMSVVYKARQLRVNRHVAIKTLRLQLDTKDIYRERFQREISSLCSLSHPNIVTVYDCIIGEDDQPYIVMDYLRGRSLEALIAHEGPMSVERFARISIQICSALEHAHKRGIIHRDLKPGNIVLMDDEMDFVKVVDFGLAKIGDQNKRLTHSGELWGSPPYMSPEQCMGEPQDQRSDLYSIGAVMYEMLCGVDPFPNASTVFEFIKNHTSVTPPPLNSVNLKVNVPPKVEAVVFKALEKDPNRRYQSAKELQDAIVEASSASVDREKGEFLFHLANQASTKSQSGHSNPMAGYPDGSVHPNDESVSASKAFKRALNPFADSMLSGGADAASSASDEVKESFTPSVERWRHPDAVGTPGVTGESIKPLAEPARPASEIVPPSAQDVAPAPPAPVISSPPPSPVPPARPQPPAAASLRKSQADVESAQSNPWLVVLLLVAVAFLVFVSWPKVFGTHQSAVTAPSAGANAATSNTTNGSSDTAEGTSAVESSSTSTGTTAGAEPANKVRESQPGRSHRHAHPVAHTPVRTNHAVTSSQPAPAPKAAAPAHGAAKADPWSALDKMR